MTGSIVDKANEVLNRAVGSDVLPVDLNKVAEKLGVLVAELPPSHRKYSGWYEKGNGRTPTAYFNPDDSPRRQRFTLAHELGHHVLEHGDSFRDPAANFSLDNFDYKEAEANRFAAELLMPRHVVKPMFDFGYSLDELANAFQVSEVAMHYRLKNLRLKS